MDYPPSKPTPEQVAAHEAMIRKYGYPPPPPPKKFDEKKFHQFLDRLYTDGCHTDRQTVDRIHRIHVWHQMHPPVTFHWKVLAALLLCMIVPLRLLITVLRFYRIWCLRNTMPEIYYFPDIKRPIPPWEQTKHPPDINDMFK